MTARPLPIAMTFAALGFFAVCAAATGFGQPEAAATQEEESIPKPPFAMPSTPTRLSGEQFFRSRDASPSKIACADCHLAQDPRLASPDNLIRPGHNLWGAFGRGGWWNGRVTTDCGEAAEICYRRFQGGEEFDGHTRTSIVLFIKSRYPNPTNPLIIHRRPPGEVDWASGEAERGRDLFRRACATCHPGGGSGAGPDLRASKMTVKEISDLIRTGSEKMPLYQGDILPDAAVADIAAYTKSLQPPEK